MSNTPLRTYLKELQQGRYRVAYYQRTPEWDFERECKFIHSMLRNASSGLFLINHVNTPDAVSRRITYRGGPQYDLTQCAFEVCDGLQRTTTLLRCNTFEGYENPYEDKKRSRTRPQEGTFAICLDAVSEYVNRPISEIPDSFLYDRFFTVIDHIDIKDPSTFEGYFPLCLVFDTPHSYWFPLLQGKFKTPSDWVQFSHMLSAYSEKNLLHETLSADFTDPDLQAVFRSVNKNGKVMSDETYSKSCISGPDFDAHKAVDKFTAQLSRTDYTNETMTKKAYANMLRAYMLRTPEYTTTELSSFVVSERKHYTYIRENWDLLCQEYRDCMEAFYTVMPMFKGGKITESMTVALLARWHHNPDVFNTSLKNSGEDLLFKWSCYGTVMKSEDGCRSALYDGLVRLEKGKPFQYKGYLVDLSKTDRVFFGKKYVETVRAAEEWLTRQIKAEYPNEDIIWIDPESSEEVVLHSAGETISNLIRIPKSAKNNWWHHPELLKLNGIDPKTLSLDPEERSSTLAKRYREFFETY